MYGYRIHANGVVVSWSWTFYSTKEDVLKDMRSRILAICEDIANDTGGLLHYWDDKFDPNNSDSCTPEQWSRCMVLYNAVQELVNRGKVYEGSGCPCELEYFITAFKYKKHFEEGV